MQPNNLQIMTFESLLTVDTRNELTNKLLDNVYIYYHYNSETRNIPVYYGHIKGFKIINHIIANSFEEVMKHIYLNKFCMNDINNICDFIFSEITQDEDYNKEIIPEYKEYIDHIKTLNSPIDVFKYIHQDPVEFYFRWGFQDTVKEYMSSINIYNVGKKHSEHMLSYNDVLEEFKSESDKIIKLCH